MFDSILVPVDVEQESSWRTVLPLAASMAREHGAVLHVVSIVEPIATSLVAGFFPADYEEKVVESVKEKLAEIVSGVELGGIEPRLHVARGTIYEEVLAAAEQLGVDLIVLFAHRPERSDFLLGPNAARIARHTRASVFVVRR